MLEGMPLFHMESSERERNDAKALARRIHRNKKLDEIVKRSQRQKIRQEPEEELLKPD